jgi:hypothetical protein
LLEVETLTTNTEAEVVLVDTVLLYWENFLEEALYQSQGLPAPLNKLTQLQLGQELQEILEALTQEVEPLRWQGLLQSVVELTMQIPTLEMVDQVQELVM